MMEVCRAHALQALLNPWNLQLLAWSMADNAAHGQSISSPRMPDLPAPADGGGKPQHYLVDCRMCMDPAVDSEVCAMVSHHITAASHWAGVGPRST